MKQFLSLLLSCFLLMGCNKLYPIKIVLPDPPKQQDSVKVFFIGDSMSSDDPNDPSMTASNEYNSYGRCLKQLYKDSAKYSFYNYAVSGVGVGEISNQAARIISEYDASKKTIVFILGAVNNISFNGMTGASCYSHIRYVHENLRTKGIKTVLIPLTSRRQLAYFSEQQSQAFWIQIKEANELFKLHHTEFTDGFIDLQNIAGFKGYEAATSSGYFSDGCHFSDLGKSELAKYCASFIKITRRAS